MRFVSFTGLALSLVGAGLDFTSVIIVESKQKRTMDTAYISMSYFAMTSLWVIGLILLGAALVITGIVSIVIPRSMRITGTLMIVYGIVMLGQWSLMYFGLAPMMTQTQFFAVYMFLIGALMIANGYLMTRLRKQLM